MPYKIIIKPEAEQEFREALFWYNTQKPDLESKLFIEISEVLDDISKYPEHFQKRYKSIRIRFTKKFKYGIHYTFEVNVIYVHAIYHTSRIPKF